MKTLASIAILASLLTGCATGNFAERRPDDVHCGTVQSKSGQQAVVDIRHYAILSCDEAVSVVAAYLPKHDVKKVWVALFTDGYAGFTVDRNFRAMPTRGFTYPATAEYPNTVVVTAGWAGLIDHELAHASDVDNGRPNTRD